MKINMTNYNDYETAATVGALLLDLASGVGAYLTTKKAITNVAMPSNKLERLGVFGMSMGVSGVILNNMPATQLVTSIIEAKNGGVTYEEVVD